MTREEAIKKFCAKTKEVLAVHGFSECDAQIGLVLFLYLEESGMIKPPMEGNLKSQFSASMNRWEDEQ